MGTYQGFQFIESLNPIYGIRLNLPDYFFKKTLIIIPLLILHDCTFNIN